jgi:hypothetical protein
MGGRTHLEPPPVPKTLQGKVALMPLQLKRRHKLVNANAVANRRPIRLSFLTIDTLRRKK